MRKNVACGLGNLVIVMLSLWVCPKVFGQAAAPPHRIQPEKWLDDAPYWMQPGMEAAKIKLHLAVGADGRVKKCSILISSGNEKLDSAGCLLATENARYVSGKNADGVAVDSSDELTFQILPHPAFRWLYPAEALRRSEQGRVTLTLDVGIDGQIKKCRVKTSSHSSSLDAASCTIERVLYRSLPPRDSLGNYQEFNDEKQVNWRIPKR